MSAVTPQRRPVHSCVIFGYDGMDLKILLVERGIPPFKGTDVIALPEGDCLVTATESRERALHF